MVTLTPRLTSPSKSGRIRVRKPARIEWGPSDSGCFEPVEVIALLSLGCAVHSRIPLPVGTSLTLNYNGLQTAVKVAYCYRRKNSSSAELGLTFLPPTEPEAHDNSLAHAAPA